MSHLPTPDFGYRSPGLGEVVRIWLGWACLSKTEESEVLLLPGALNRDGVLLALAAVGDWVLMGTSRTLWALPLGSSCRCSYSYGQGTAVEPCTGERCWSLLSGLWRAFEACCFKEFLNCSAVHMEGPSPVRIVHGSTMVTCSSTCAVRILTWNRNG